MSTYEQIDEFTGRGKNIRKYQKKRKSKLERLQGELYIQNYLTTEEEQQKFTTPMKGWTM
jgi:plasmid replication initiation protein